MGQLLRAFGGDALVLPGQVKPTGIPRIDWTHPLTRNLIIYWFDTGMGFYIDLCSGGISVVGAGSTAPPLGVSPWGAGFAWANGSQALPQVIQSATPFYLQAWTGPYSFGCGYFQYTTGPTAEATLWALIDSSSNDPWAISTTAGSVIFDYNSVNGINTPQPAGYATLIGTANTTVGSAYVNGGTNIGVASGVGFTPTAAKIVIGGLKPDDTTATDIGAFVFWGATWLTELTIQEVNQIHTDPYCFLIPPEGEFSQLSLSSIIITNPIGAPLITNAAGEPVQIGTKGTTFASISDTVIPTTPGAQANANAAALTVTTSGGGGVTANPPGAVITTTAQTLVETVNTFPTGTTGTTGASIFDTIIPFPGGAAETTSAGLPSLTIGAFPSAAAVATSAQVPVIAIITFLVGAPETSGAGSAVAKVGPTITGTSETTGAGTPFDAGGVPGTGGSDTTAAASIFIIANTFPGGVLETTNAGSPFETISFVIPGAAETTSAGSAGANVGPQPAGAAETTGAAALKETINVFPTFGLTTTNAAPVSFVNTAIASPAGAAETTSAGLPTFTINVMSMASALETAGAGLLFAKVAPAVVGTSEATSAGSPTDAANTQQSGGAATMGMAALALTVITFPSGTPLTTTATALLSTVKAPSLGVSETTSAAALTSTLGGVSGAGTSSGTSTPGIKVVVLQIGVAVQTGPGTISFTQNGAASALGVFASATAGIATVTIPVHNPVRKVRAHLGFPGGVTSIGRGRGSNTNVSISGPTRKGN